MRAELRTIFASLARANERLVERLHIRNIRGFRHFPQAKLDRDIIARFLLNKHGDLWRYFSAGKQATWTQDHPGFHSKNFWLSLINWPIMSYFMSYDMDTTWCPATSNKNCGLALGFLTASCGESLDVSVRFEISPWERWLGVFCRVFEQLIIYRSQIDLFIHSPAPQSSSKACSVWSGLKWFEVDCFTQLIGRKGQVMLRLWF